MKRKALSFNNNRPANVATFTTAAAAAIFAKANGWLASDVMLIAWKKWQQCWHVGQLISAERPIYRLLTESGEWIDIEAGLAVKEGKGK